MRSGRCFIFTLEDRTLGSSSNTRDNGNDEDNERTKMEEEYGVEPGKLYGICVVHPRLLLTTADGPIASSDIADPSGVVELEAQVCFAFITRFPFFEFFFSIIFDIILEDRTARTEKVIASLQAIGPVGESSASGSGQQHYSIDPALFKSMLSYEYLPRSIIQKVLSHLSLVKVPKFNESIEFSWRNDKSAPPIKLLREKNAGMIKMSEYEFNAAEWSLPALLMWIPPSHLMWLIGLLLTETKVIVIGSEPGLVSCAIMGLLALLRPFTWVMPIIPVLPSKHMDFVESPVPILAGVVIESSANMENTVKKIIRSCNDAENGTITAVFDITNREIYMSGHHYDIVPQLLLPGAQALVDRLKMAIEEKKDIHLHNYSTSNSIFLNISANHKQAAQRAQKVVVEYLETIIIMAQDASRKATEYYNNQQNSLNGDGSKNKIRSDSADSEGLHSRDSVSAPTSSSDNVDALFSFYGSLKDEELIKLSSIDIDSESSYLDSFLKRFVLTQIYSEFCDNEKSS
jgi:hypothetical protein